MTIKSSERIAILSCIHGNMEALEAVMDDVKSQKPDLTVCLGDLVGYGPYPNEVVEFIEHNNISTLMGCWDEGISMDRDDCGCKFVSEEDATYGHQAFAWTRERLKKKNRKFLKSLSFALAEKHTPAGDLLFVHGSPRGTSEYLMESTHDLILFERAAAGGCDILICGHTHVPFARKVEGMLRVQAEAGLKNKIQSELRGFKNAPTEIKLSPKLIINAGSVGEPRHGSSESTYVIFDTGSKAVEIREVAYNVQKTVQAIRKACLPEAFAERLMRGEELAAKNKEIACAC